MTDDLYRHDYTGSAIRSYGDRPDNGGQHGGGMIWPGYAKGNAERDRAKADRDKAWAPEHDGAMSEVRMLTFYMGENADSFLKHHKIVGKRMAFSFNLAAFFAPLAWCFYRKLYAVGLMLLILPMVAVLIIPDISDFSSVTAVVAIAVCANPIYLAFATKRVNELKKQANSQKELRELLITKGGTSTVGAIFGLLITISMLALPFLTGTLGR
ncbi:DUF2628 domain-containing protein [Cohaesibacter celericrescens]|uniref:DUF2628 domain-containing protein n=1 Tax=Cohaesibacter celericrescens TaxID=2067669 RepID=UPI003568A34F